jgi:hypothetical protein
VILRHRFAWIGILPPTRHPVAEFPLKRPKTAGRPDRASRLALALRVLSAAGLRAALPDGQDRASAWDGRREVATFSQRRRPPVRCRDAGYPSDTRVGAADPGALHCRRGDWLCGDRDVDAAHVAHRLGSTATAGDCCISVACDRLSLLVVSLECLRPAWCRRRHRLRSRDRARACTRVRLGSAWRRSGHVRDWPGVRTVATTTAG